MTDIELVIKLPEKTYHMINAGFYDYGDMNVIIQNSIPLDKIRAEIRAESKKNYTNSIFNKGLYRAIEIIDKYREVSE